MILRSLILVVALVALAAGSAPPGVATGSAPAPGSRANVWVDGNGGSCRRTAAPKGYGDGRACASLEAAYRAAAARDVIVVRAGTYGPQVVPAGTKRITIRNATRARPVFGTTTVNASNVTLSGVTIRRDDDPAAHIATLEAVGDDNTFVGVHVNTKFMYARQGLHAKGDRNVFRHGSTFNVIDEKGALVGGSGVTFIDFDFHDVRVTGSAIHNECVYASAGGLTIRRSHFWNCPTMDLFITRGTWWNQPAYGNVTIENNVFEHSTMEEPGSWHHYGLLFGGQLAHGGAPLHNLKVRYNTFEQPVGLEGSFRATGDSEWVGNVGGGWDCIPGMRFAYNVGEKCSATDKRVEPPSSCGPPACRTLRTAAQGWVDPGKHNFRLRAGAPAINAGDPRDAPRVDKDGKRRPAGGRPDAGAYEYRRR
jgi:hypothetical protein